MKILIKTAFLGFLLVPAAVCLHAQTAAGKRSTSIDLAASGVFERGKATTTSNFWFKGASADGAYTFYRGLGVAVDGSVMRNSAIAPGVGLSKMTFVFGPRYTLAFPHTSHRVRVYGEALFGGVHAFNTIVPRNGSIVYSANAYAMQLGGGVNVMLTHGFGIRLVEADYICSHLPNGSDNLQQDARIGFGVVWSSRR